MTHNVSRCLVLLMACSCLPAGSARAQDLTQARFTSVRRLQCVFTAAAGGVWQGGTAAVRPRSEVLLRLDIDAIDAQDGTATMRDVPESAAHLVAQFSGWTLHVIQTDGTGGLSVTSVFARESRDGKLKAVHSRANYLPGGTPDVEPSAQQFYGECGATFQP
jgi:hypothetical protein